MLEKGFTRPSKSKICSPLFLIDKKDSKEHPVIDYRGLNSITEPDEFPISLLQEMINKVQREKLFLKVDISKGFYNICVAEVMNGRPLSKPTLDCTNPWSCNLG